MTLELQCVSSNSGIFGPVSDGLKKFILNEETIKSVPTAPTSVTPKAQGEGQPSFTFGTYLNNVKKMNKQVTIKEGAETGPANSGAQGKDALPSKITTSILKPVLRRSAAASILSTFIKSEDSNPEAGK